jgi:hypothetical protein
LLSDKGKSTLRCIDNVVMNENKIQPREIYTFDMNYPSESDNMALTVEGVELGALVKHESFE